VPGDPRIRASDADRDRAAALLREHHAAGRLTAEEFDDRMNKALEAKTLDEIDELLADLPAIELYRLPHESMRHTPPGTRRSRVPNDPTGLARFTPGTVAMGAWAVVTSALVAVWAVTAVLGGTWYPWWALVVVPWMWVLIRRGRHRRE
jgi:hypothetical protein